ncbi:YfiR/HmsC family protein [Olleya sp. YS]|uniref:YfiR/HmsC family protein n=1 Tax=Olleya sp. YS TaxID=3028318 RepID=UPI0024341853|nr:YfiR/HmsC family protein [Olleya sp. YS]WGD34269.1 YfiR/HmsC family protein [Olleya sp. YS]
MTFNNRSSVLKNYYKALVLCTLSFFLGVSTHAQDYNNEQVKRLQRAIFVYNFAQQVGWQNQQDSTSFKIGVLGPDRAIIDFKSLAQKRKINNKPVTVVSFNAVKDVKDIQLLYVNKAYNFDINYILNKISGKNILLVTEDYNYNTSMINIVNVGDSFEYEINSQLINKEGFATASSLKQYAVSSSQKWKDLYQNTEASLKDAKQKEAQQESIIKNKEAQIQSQKQQISTQDIVIDTILNSVLTKDQWIKTLSNQSELQKQKFEDKVKIEQLLEDNIRQQVEFIKSQEEKITSSNLEIQKQDALIKNQNAEIEKRELILKQKDSTIVNQKTTNTLLIALVGLALFAALLIYRSYLSKKKLSKALEVKNAAIQKQSLELESKNDELEQFAYIASHDLKEPLITISSLINMLVEENHDKFDDEGKMTLDYITESSNRMQKLIDAILQYSRLGKSKTITDVDCNTIVTILKDDLKNVIDRTNTKIITSNLPTVKGAELELRLLFQNLISNGIKFTKKETTPIITIDCIRKTDNALNDFWEFSIKDNGIGIPEKHKERIFSIFQRLHSREEYEGTGIGLAHCKKIVEAHGGRIWLESVVNKGSTFYFTIPA